MIRFQINLDEKPGKYELQSKGWVPFPSDNYEISWLYDLEKECVGKGVHVEGLCRFQHSPMAWRLAAGEAPSPPGHDTTVLLDLNWEGVPFDLNLFEADQIAKEIH
jgi:hypothetical protein